MRIIRKLVPIFLVIVFCVFGTTFVRKKIQDAKLDAEIASVKRQIRNQQLKNGELEDILSEENLEDFYRTQAEDNLGWGFPHEKVYQDITGK